MWMKKRAQIFAAAGAFLILFAGMASAEEQWLQYRKAAEVYQVLGNVSLSRPEMQKDTPEGLELPEFEGKEQRFCKWTSDMVDGGFRWFALDRRGTSGPFDRLYFDTNGDGKLTADEINKPCSTEVYSNNFGPVPVIYEGEDGPVTYHLNIESYSYDSANERVYVRTGGWYEGEIVVGGGKKYCVLIDYNANAAFDDKANEKSTGDRIRIGAKDDRTNKWVGKLIEVDGQLYRPRIAKDGAFIELTRADDVQFGQVKVPESVSELVVGGENGLFEVALEKGLGRLPVGEYMIQNYAVDKKDDKGVKWRADARFYESRKSIEIVADARLELDIGEPFTSRLDSRKQDERTYNFDQELRGRMGETITLTRNGSRPSAPKLNVKGAKGEYDRTYAFSYG
jgi:hypothetical protein